MSRCFLGCALTLALGSALASDDRWVEVGTSTSDAVLFIDSWTMRRSGNTVTYWSKMILTSGRYFVTKSEANCAELRFRYLQTTFYEKDGSNRTVDGPEPWNEVTPDSMTETGFIYACAKTLSDP